MDLKWAEFILSNILENRPNLFVKLYGSHNQNIKPVTYNNYFKEINLILDNIKKIMTKVKILDCTLRDGGYHNNWDLVKTLLAGFLQEWKNLH